MAQPHATGDTPTVGRKSAPHEEVFIKSVSRKSSGNHKHPCGSSEKRAHEFGFGCTHSQARPKSTIPSRQGSTSFRASMACVTKPQEQSPIPQQNPPCSPRGAPPNAPIPPTESCPSYTAEYPASKSSPPLPPHPSPANGDTPPGPSCAMPSQSSHPSSKSPPPAS